MDREERAMMRKLADQLDQAEDFQQSIVAIIQMQQEIAKREGHPLPTPPMQMGAQGPMLNLQELHATLRRRLDALDGDGGSQPPPGQQGPPDGAVGQQHGNGLVRPAHEPATP